MPQSWSIFWHDQEGYGQVLPRPDPEDVAEYYNVEAYYTHEAFPEESQPGAEMGFLHRVLTHLAWRADQGCDPDGHWWQKVLGTESKRILEIGCGSGGNLSTLQSLGHSAVGVEPDVSARARALENGHEVYPGTAEALPDGVKDRAYDVIVFMHVREHCWDPIKAIENARNLLTADGMIIAEVPNNDYYGAAFFRENWYWLDVPRHLNFFTEKSLSALLRNNGYVIRSLSYRGYTRQFTAEWIRNQERIGIIMRPGSPVTGMRLYWHYFLRTFAAPARRKYDSVRIVAERHPIVS
jgi:SAM-dependent methyltransferase